MTFTNIIPLNKYVESISIVNYEYYVGNARTEKKIREWLVIGLLNKTILKFHKNQISKSEEHNGASNCFTITSKE